MENITVDKQIKKVAIQGIEGCFHHEAARRFWSEPIELVPALTFDEAMDNLMTQKADYGVMAIENSLAGSIIPNYNLLRKSGAKVCGEISLHIALHMMALPGSNLDDIREVHSHPMAIHQCKVFLNQFPSIKRVESIDTALSARDISENKMKGTAAIAGKLAAEKYGLEIIKEGIESHKDNYTRFLIISGKGERDGMPITANAETGNLKASLYFQTKHRKGILAMVLTTIAVHGINLVKLQSHPVPSRNKLYGFYIDLEISSKDQLLKLLEDLEDQTTLIEILGVYQKENE